MTNVSHSWHTPRGADEKLRKSFGHLRLLDVLLGISEACRKWARGTLSSKIPVLQGKSKGNPIFYWMAAETARHAIKYCARPASDSNLILPRANSYDGWNTLEELINVAVDVQLNVPVEPVDEWEETLGADIWGAFGQIWLRQYIMQRRSPYRAAQALLMYRDAPKRRNQRDSTFPLSNYEAALGRVLGTTLEQFLFVLLQAAGRASSDSPALSYDTLSPIADRRYDYVVGTVDDHGLHASAYPGLFSALSASPESMMAWSRERLLQLAPKTDDERIQFDGPNPLTRYPLVQCFPDRADRCIAPVPHLIEEWLYEPLMDLLARELGIGSQLGQDIGASLFEEYLGLLADRSSPNGPGWMHESMLKPSESGRKVVDWARVIGEDVVLIDAKRAYVEPSARGRWEPRDWSSVKKSLIKGVTQACEFWRAVKDGVVPSLRGTTASPIALVVTQGDSSFYTTTAAWRAEVNSATGSLREQVPWIALSLDDYEKLMTAWSQNDALWLPSILRKTVAEDPQRSIVGLSRPAAGPLWQEFRNFLATQNRGCRPRTRETA
ncbi:MAG: hypothetical protein QM831_11925 [Kofleriaceae bacterium]